MFAKIAKNTWFRSYRSSRHVSNLAAGYSRDLETLEGAIVRRVAGMQTVSGRGSPKRAPGGMEEMKDFLGRLWWTEEGQDVAEYAVMLAVILVIVVGTVKLIGSNSNNVFSSVASSIGS